MADYVIGEGSDDAIEYLIGWPAVSTWLNRHIAKSNLIVKKFIKKNYIKKKIHIIIFF